jgi:hypothetical protein
MNNGTLLTTGIVGTIIAALCCMKPPLGAAGKNSGND